MLLVKYRDILEYKLNSPNLSSTLEGDILAAPEYFAMIFCDYQIPNHNASWVEQMTRL